MTALDIKTRCLKYISLENALKSWTIDIDKLQIEKQISKPVDYYVCCIWNKNIDTLQTMHT